MSAHDAGKLGIRVKRRKKNRPAIAPTCAWWVDPHNQMLGHCDLPASGGVAAKYGEGEDSYGLIPLCGPHIDEAKLQGMPTVEASCGCHGENEHEGIR